MMERPLLAVAVLGFVLLAALLLLHGQNAEKEHLLSVAAEAEKEVAPDEASLWLGVETRALTAQGAQQNNREMSTAVQKALRDAGVKEEEIETVEYGVERIREWEKERMVEKGYRTRHILKVTTKKLDDVGKIADAAVQAGANDVERVSFALSQEKEREIAKALLQEAAQRARQKADALARGMDIRLGKAVSLSESSGVAMPYDSNYRFAEMAMAEAALPTPIAPKKIVLRASVEAAFEIK